MQERMLVEHLSESTITTYIHFAKRLIDYHGILPRGISTEQIYEFLSELRVKQGLSNSTIKQAVGSIKYLYRHILNIPKRVEGIPYPRQEKHSIALKKNLVRSYMVGIRRAWHLHWVHC